MLVSWKWLNELVSTSLDVHEAAELLTRSGLEVEGLASLNLGVEKVVSGVVLEIETHPQADKLFVVKVDVGEEVLTIVTGADNLFKGACVPVAQVGAKLPCESHPYIEKTELRGILSEGMLCGADELGLDVNKLMPEEKEGIYLLPEGTLPGQSVIELLGFDDVVMELGLTPNRSDCMGMFNVAREVAALTGSTLTLPEIELSKALDQTLNSYKIELHDPTVCSRFAIRRVKQVKVGPSPLWLKQRLMSMGVRSINNMVDISNLVMLEMNHPVHFFDEDKLRGKVIGARLAQEGETLVTLDGQTRLLDSAMSVVIDENGPVALAGVMGGLETEVTESTKNVVIEAACWDPVRTRKTAQRLGLRSEASQRFEKGVDPLQATAVLDRAVQLIERLGAGVGQVGYLETVLSPYQPPRTNVRLEKINRVLGTFMGLKEVEGFWVSLQIKILETYDDGWLLESPSWRRDLIIEEDYIEEAVRLFGYDRLESTLPEGKTTQGFRTPEHETRRTLAKGLLGLGFREAINYSFINPDHLDRLKVPAGHQWRNAVHLMNPLSEEQGVLRTTVIPSMLELAKWNLNHRNKDLKMYEIGKVYYAKDNEELQPDERWTLALMCSGKESKGWNSIERSLDFFYLKGALENIIAAAGVKEHLEWIKNNDLPGLHPGRSAEISCNNIVLGYLGEIHPRVSKIYEIEDRVVVASLDIQALNQVKEEPVYRPLSRYPEVTRDLALVVPVHFQAQDVLKTIQDYAGNLLRSVRLFDQYMGSQIAENHKSLAFALTWQAEDRTLKDEEIKTLHVEIEAQLQDIFGGKVRGRD